MLNMITYIVQKFTLTIFRVFSTIESGTSLKITCHGQHQVASLFFIFSTLKLCQIILFSNPVSKSFVYTCPLHFLRDDNVFFTSLTRETTNNYSVGGLLQEYHSKPIQIISEETHGRITFPQGRGWENKALIWGKEVRRNKEKEWLVQS